MYEHNGGNLNDKLIRVLPPIPESMEYYIDDGGYISIESINGIDLDLTMRNKEIAAEWELPDGLVVLCGDGHVFIALDYRQQSEEPTVIYLESASMSFVTLANSFQEFLDSLKDRF